MSMSESEMMKEKEGGLLLPVKTSWSCLPNEGMKLLRLRKGFTV